MGSENSQHCLGSGDPNPHWFHIAIFPVTAVNPLKIRQYSLRNLLCYRKNCLCETASTCSAEFLQRISVRKGAGGLTPVKTDKAEDFVKIQPTGNAGSSPRCLSLLFVFLNRVVRKRTFKRTEQISLTVTVAFIVRLNFAAAICTFAQNLGISVRTSCVARCVPANFAHSHSSFSFVSCQDTFVLKNYFYPNFIFVPLSFVSR